MGKYSIPGVDYVAKPVYVDEAPQPRSRAWYNLLKTKAVHLAQAVFFLSLPWLIGFGLLLAAILCGYGLMMVLDPQGASFSWFVLVNAVARALDYSFVAGLVVAFVMFFGRRR